MTSDQASLPPIAILGAGSMGGAILHGLVGSGLAREGVTVTNRTPAKAQALVGLEGVTRIALEVQLTGYVDAASGASVVLVGV